MEILEVVLYPVVDTIYIFHLDFLHVFEAIHIILVHNLENLDLVLDFVLTIPDQLVVHQEEYHIDPVLDEVVLVLDMDWIEMDTNNKVIDNHFLHLSFLHLSFLRLLAPV